MIELTTGVLLLVSSFYGSGDASVQVANAISSTESEKGIEVIKQNSFTINDPKVMENYLRNEYVDRPVLVEIARCESSFRHYDKDGKVIRGKANKADIGIMQINEKYHTEAALKLGYDLSTVNGNVAYAKYLYDKEGTRPWSASESCWSKVGNTLAKN